MLNDFYTITLVSDAAGTATYGVRFSAAHAIFDGHFPGQPVVPGVCTMHITRALLERSLGMSLQVKEARQIKFLQLLTPELQPEATITWSVKEDGNYGLESTWTLDGKAVFKMSATLAAG